MLAIFIPVNFGVTKHYNYFHFSYQTHISKLLAKFTLEFRADRHLQPVFGFPLFCRE